MPHFLGRLGIHSSVLEGFEFIVPFPPSETSLVGLFWPSLTLLALHSHDLQSRFSALRQQSPCPSQVATNTGDRRLKENVSAFLCCTPLGTFLQYTILPLAFLQLSPYMALNWLQVHLLRGIT